VIPPYAILSHTWGQNEVRFRDVEEGTYNGDSAKIEGCCKQTLSGGLEYIWIDTCCIDKSSSTDVSEAINSMYAYYRDSKVCYAYLEDVSTTENNQLVSLMRRSRWFTRGWTLQELIAPSSLIFFSRTWTRLGTRESYQVLVSEITGIQKDHLAGRAGQLSRASAARKMSWLAGRTTTRVEDMAYCMLGIFEINMPLLYGEGMKAFIRLQEETIKVSHDHSIFCWTWLPTVPENWVSMLAPFPAVFRTLVITLSPECRECWIRTPLPTLASQFACPLSTHGSTCMCG